MQDIILENRHFRLVIGLDCRAKSLFCKDTAQECLAGKPMPLCSVPQSRFYNNENKLAHPTCRMTLQANRVRREGNRLLVGFELTPYEAVLEVTQAEDYIAFRLTDFVVPDGSPGGDENGAVSGRRGRF